MTPYLSWISILYYWSWKNDLFVLICLAFSLICMMQWTPLCYQNNSSLVLLFVLLIFWKLSPISSVVWFEISLRWIALLWLHVNNNMYDLFCLEFFFLYIIGPAKSGPITWNSLIPAVLSFVSWPGGPGGGVSYDLIWYRLQPWQFLIILFVNCLNFGIH